MLYINYYLSLVRLSPLQGHSQFNYNLSTDLTAVVTLCYNSKTRRNYFFNDSKIKQLNFLTFLQRKQTLITTPNVDK